MVSESVQNHVYMVLKNAYTCFLKSCIHGFENLSPQPGRVKKTLQATGRTGEKPCVGNHVHRVSGNHVYRVLNYRCRKLPLGGSRWPFVRGGYPLPRT